MGAALSATNVTDVQIANCTISTSGTDGIIIDGRDSTVSVSRDDQTQLSLSDSDQPASLSFRIHRLCQPASLCSVATRSLGTSPT